MWSEKFEEKTNLVQKKLNWKIIKQVKFKQCAELFFILQSASALWK